MRCAKCDKFIGFDKPNFCPYCRAEVEPQPVTPNRKETFKGVKNIYLGVVAEIYITPSLTKETTVDVKAPENLKKDFKFSLVGGTLSIDCPSSDDTVILGRKVIARGNISRNIIIGNINHISMDDSFPIGDSEDTTVVITISTPIGTNITIYTTGIVSGTIGDLFSKIILDTSGSCRFAIGKISDFEAEASGIMNVTIDTVSNGNCTVVSNSSCNLEIDSVNVKEMNVSCSGSAKISVNSGTIACFGVEASGSTTLNIKAKTKSAHLEANGILSGSLYADKVETDINGLNRLNIIR